MRRQYGLFAAAALIITCIPAWASRPARVQIAAELSTKNVRIEESPLADVIVDAIREAAGADLAFMAASSFADTTISKGTGTEEDFLKALTFRAELIRVVKLSGDKIRKALEMAVAQYPGRHAAFLQVSGLKVEIDPNAEKDHRVTSVKVGSSSLVDTKIYRVAMPSPLANGGLIYLKLWGSADIDKDKSTDKTLEDAVTEYLSSKRNIDKSEGRLVFKK